MLSRSSWSSNVTITVVDLWRRCICCSNAPHPKANISCSDQWETECCASLSFYSVTLKPGLLIVWIIFSIFQSSRDATPNIKRSRPEKSYLGKVISEKWDRTKYQTFTFLVFHWESVSFLQDGALPHTHTHTVLMREGKTRLFYKLTSLNMRWPPPRLTLLECLKKS